MALTLLYETVEQVGTRTVEFRLYTDGTFTMNDEVKPWFRKSDKPDAKPWIPAKRQTFRSLVKQAIREGDYDEPRT